MKVRLQVIKVYDIDVDTTDREQAIDKAYDLSSVEVEDTGNLIDCQTDNAEIWEGL